MRDASWTPRTPTHPSHSAFLPLLQVRPARYDGVDLRAAEGSRLIIIGDTHGQLQDVLWIFKESRTHFDWVTPHTIHLSPCSSSLYRYGPPSRTNAHLFNGDVADRGAYVQIFALLFAYMALDPGSVYLNRGNHE